MVSELSVCVPVYKRHDEPNIATLASALPAACGACSAELVVALNGIDADNARVPPGARTTALEHNMGVAPGWNAAARDARGEILVFANDDVVPGPGSLERLAGVLRGRPDAGVVGPVGATFDRSTWRRVAFVEPEAGVAACEGVGGFLLAPPREAWRGVGGFEEASAPASWEEIAFTSPCSDTGFAPMP